MDDKLNKIYQELKEITDKNIQYALNNLDIYEDDFKKIPNFGIKLNRLYLSDGKIKIKYYLSKNINENSFDDINNILLISVIITEENDFILYDMKNFIINKELLVDINLKNGKINYKSNEI